MFSSRFIVFFLSILIAAITLALGLMDKISLLWSLAPVLTSILGIYDVIQNKHSILRNYPIIGHFRYIIESFGPELRQYLIEDDNQERPFSRAQRAVVYQRSKAVSDVRAFGANIEMGDTSYEWITHSMNPSNIKNEDFRVIIGGERKRPYAMSVFNISAMSFGSLSANAIKALNKGAKMGGFAHDTGEGSVSKYHRENGGDLVWEIGSGYFGCRNSDGTFSPELFKKVAGEDQVKMIEIKISQGAKPGHGGVLPASKITPEIAETRGIPMGVDCVSPSGHSKFSTPMGLMDFITELRELSDGKPVGFKLCIGHPWEFMATVKAMLKTGITPDFIVVDGGEGGTGAAPIEFADHVGSPLHESLLFVHNCLVATGLRDKIKLGASGKIITAFDIAKAFSLGADYLNSGRGFLFSLGCIQALNCSSGNCPTGIATQDPVRQKALDVDVKAQRVYNYHRSTLHALKELLQAVGVTHPDQINSDHIMRRINTQTIASFSDIMTFMEENELLREGAELKGPFLKFWNKTDENSFNLKV